jgi:hypothetical protein
VNLVDSREITTALLLDPLAWRVRAVEHLEIDGAYSCLRRRSLQCAPLRPVLGDLLPPDQRNALIALNVAPMPRGPLLDLDVEGPDGQAFLLPRAEIAAREADLLHALARMSGLAMSEPCRQLLECALGLSELAQFSEFAAGGFPVGQYLADGLSQSVPPQTQRAWIELSDEIATILAPRSDDPTALDPVKNPILSIPDLAAAADLTFHDVTEALDDYRRLLIHAQAGANPTHPTSQDDLLNSLADYGRHYDLMVAVKVPLDEPFIVRHSERRDLHLTRIRNRGSQELVIADAQSNHVALDVADTNVRLLDVEARQPGGGVTFGGFAVRKTRQFWTFYAHDLDRDYSAVLKFRLRPLFRLEAVPYVVASVLVLIAVALWHGEVRRLTDLALIVGPSGVAASVLLAREQSTLGSRLRVLSSATLALALLFVLLSAVALYLCWSPSEGVATLLARAGRA